MRVTKKLIGRASGTVRFLMDTGSHVVAHPDGRYTCIHSECVGKGIGAQSCKHVEVVRACDDGKDEGYDETPRQYPTSGASNEGTEISAPDAAYGDGFKFLPSPSRTIDRQHAAD